MPNLGIPAGPDHPRSRGAARPSAKMGAMTSRATRAPRPLRAALAIASLGLALGLTACGDDEQPSVTPAELTPSSGEPASSAPASEAPGSEAPAGPTLDLTVEGDRVDPTNKSFEVTSGQTLTIVVTSDRAGELHVHSSPEQELEFKAGTTRLEVLLKQPGQVDIEEHESDALVARVLVK